MIALDVIKFLENNEFVMMASCRQDMQPNVSPKFLLKVEGDCIYLGDYNIDRTWANLKGNDKVSLASMDNETLYSIQINGVVEEVEEGDVYESLIDEFNAKKLHLSTKRVIDGLHQGKAHKQFEMIFPDRVIIHKIKAKEVIKINPAGTLEVTNLVIDGIAAKEEG